tara:strand:- start:430 stop:1263 length:834 start_codon:yes stop_codon:yes gene_type:complete
MKNYRSNTNQLANLKNNPIVRQAIQRDKDIKTTQRSTNFGYAAASLLIPGGFLTGIGKKAIGQAFKNAGSLFKNTRGADTVGNRIKQTLAINPKLVNNSPRFANQFGKGQPVMNEQGVRVGTGGTTSYVGLGKEGRTIQNAVEQGPAKYFSKVKNNPKTGIMSGKRKYDSPRRQGARREKDQYEVGLENSRGPYSDLAEDYSVLKNQFNKSLLRKMQPNPSKKYTPITKNEFRAGVRIKARDMGVLKPNPLLINNEDLIKKTLAANRLARKILKNGK